MVELLNKNLGKENHIKSLSIKFTNPTKPNENYEIKFPKYLKNLKRLSIHNIADKNFTETLFDLGS